MPINNLDLSDRSLYQNGFPHALFARLRKEAPVFLHPATEGVKHFGGEPFWVLSRFEDIRQVSRDTEGFAASDGPSIQRFEVERRNMTLVSMDPPDHRRLRGLISKGFFLPRMVDQLEQHIRNRSREIVDQLIKEGGCEFVNDVAYRLPMNIIADLVGIPEADRSELFDWVSRLMLAGEPSLNISEEERAGLEASIFSYGIELAAHKRKQPGDDVWSVLTHAEIEDEHGNSSKLSDLELALFFLVLSIAGSETTRNALSGGLLAFEHTPAQKELFIRHAELHDQATEEILRWTSPVLFFARTARRDTELAGHSIKAGERVSLWYASANRDEAEFVRPNEFDIRREANRQIAFGGGGPHFCLGSHLARRQIKVMFKELYQRAPQLKIGDTSWYVAGLQNNVSCSLAPFTVECL